VLYLFLLNNNLLREYFHSVDTFAVLLSDLENLTKSALPDELENVKVFWAVGLLVGVLETESNADFASDQILFAFSWLEFIPTLVGCLVRFKVWAKSDVTEEGLIVLLVVDGNVKV